MSEISLAGSKSITNRAVVLAGMSHAPVLIKNFLFSDDTNAAIKCLELLGFKIEINNLDVLISPPDIKSLNTTGFYDQTFELNFECAGTLARFFPAVILNWHRTFPESKKITAKLFAQPQLQGRPILPLIEALKNLGGSVIGREYPFLVKSSDLKGEVEIDTTESSQFLSGLLFAKFGAKNKVTIRQKNVLPQQGYVDMTLSILNQFNEKKSDNTLKEIHIEPDASTACYYLAIAFLHNFPLTIHGLGKNSLQPDVLFCQFLKKLGASLSIGKNAIKVNKRTNTKIYGGFVSDFSLISDQALTAGVLALFADKPIQITGVSHIRKHESNRIDCFVKNFKNLGWNISEHWDGFTIYPFLLKKFKMQSGTWKTYHDHRFAMSGFILSSINSKIIIENPECISKTCPRFFLDIEKIWPKLISNYNEIIVEGKCKKL